MYPQAAEKIWATFFWFYPLKQLFFWNGSRFPGRGFCWHRNPLSGKALHNISDGLSIKHDELFESTFLEDDISHSRWTSRLGMIKFMNADIIEVKNNESLMQCYHLMVVVNKM